MVNFLFLQSLIFYLVPLLIVFLIVWLILSRVLKRYDEKLRIERENTISVQKKVDDLNERLVVVEKMLKEVE